MPSLIYLLLKLRYLDCKTISKPSGIKEEDRTYTQKQQAQITPHKRSQDPQIPPSIPKVQSKALIELITDLIRTVLTSTRRIIHNIPIPSPLEETRHVLPTSLSRRRSKMLQLFRRASHSPAMQFRDDHAADEARERVELIQPRAPEFRDLRLRDGDAAEERECDDDEWIQERGDERRGCDCSDHLTESYGKELGDEHHEELIPCS